uniref:Protein kinase domain-containing protein n=1 Tax=Nelumbo nucifera TaxID=4432 RepID=A0A822ZLP6_NELNU|nr:TPA_asm: hypothetical protein HUJ06_003620 [Nelumbo nucifera]
MKRRRRQQKTMEMGSDGRTWTRGATIGKGSFGTVSLAKTTGPNKRRSYLPPSIAVKWTEVSDSYSLQKEKEILSNFSGCPYILHCFGEEVTVENGQMIYNVLLEYGAGGSLADRIRNSAGGLPESEVKRYTRSILRGLSYIHAQSYVHCDIKPQNILLVPASSLIKKRRKGEDYVAKIADFGVAKKVQQKWKNETPCWRGTPLYMSPESIAHNSQEPPSDIWALGCVVSEMISGKPAWSCKPGETRDDLLQRIGWSHELPRIPGDLSNEGKDFLKRCFVRTTMFRWTAEMLLHHPFVASDGEDIGELERICIFLRVQKR